MARRRHAGILGSEFAASSCLLVGSPAPHLVSKRGHGKESPGRRQSDAVGRFAFVAMPGSASGKRVD